MQLFVSSLFTVIYKPKIVFLITFGNCFRHGAAHMAQILDAVSIVAINHTAASSVETLSASC